MNQPRWGNGHTHISFPSSEVCVVTIIFIVFLGEMMRTDFLCTMIGNLSKD